MIWVEFLNGVWLASLRLVLPSPEYQSPTPPNIQYSPLWYIMVHYRILGIFNNSRGMGGVEYQGEGIIVGTIDRLCSWGHPFFFFALLVPRPSCISFFWCLGFSF